MNLTAFIDNSHEKKLLNLNRLIIQFVNWERIDKIQTEFIRCVNDETFPVKDARKYFEESLWGG